MKFPCSQCGLCCQKIDHVDALNNFNRGDGVCIHYSVGSGCAIYSTRPLACRIDEGYEVYARHKMTKLQYYKRNAEICNGFQIEAALPEKFRILL